MEKKKIQGKCAAVLLGSLMLSGFSGTAVSAAEGKMPADTLPKDAEILSEHAARGVLGDSVPLTSAWNGECFLFTCRNGYALVDPRRGFVTEYALSPGEVCFPEDPEADEQSNK